MFQKQINETSNQTPNNASACVCVCSFFLFLFFLFFFFLGGGGGGEGERAAMWFRFDTEQAFNIR
jgi:hypothetical protein